MVLFDGYAVAKGVITGTRGKKLLRNFLPRATILNGYAIPHVGLILVTLNKKAAANHDGNAAAFSAFKRKVNHFFEITVIYVQLFEDAG